MTVLKRRRRQALEVTSRLSLSRSFGSDDDPFMAANLACSSRDIASDPSRDTSNTASPELVAQVSHLEALLSSQQTELNDSTCLPGQEEEEDDNLAAELADLAESEQALRKELEQLQLAGQLKLKAPVQEDHNILHNDRNRGWGLWHHLTIRASLVMAIVTTIMLSRPVVVERQGEVSQNTLVVAGPPPTPDDMESTLVAFEPSLSERALAAELKYGQALDTTVKLYSTQTIPSLSLIPFLSWNATNPPVAANSLDCYGLGRQLLAGAVGTTGIMSCDCRCKLEMMGEVQLDTDEVFMGVTLTVTTSYTERFTPLFEYECLSAAFQPQGQVGGVDWKHRFTKASLLLTATWSYADRFVPATIDDHGSTAPSCVYCMQKLCTV
jgi:hypothetical protein